MEQHNKIDSVVVTRVLNVVFISYSDYKVDQSGRTVSHTIS